MIHQSVIKGNDKLFDVLDSNNKKAIIAILLSLFPGLGQVYSGYIYRGVIGYLGLVILSWMCAYIFLHIESRTISIVILSLPFVYALSLCVDAVFCVIRQASNKNIITRQKLFIHILIFILIFISVSTLIDYMVGKHVVRAFFVTTKSMMPNIYKYDLILVDKTTKKPIKGDVVLLEFSKKQNDTAITNVIEDQTLRRIIASEGDKVELVGKNLYINDKRIIESYVSFGISESHNIYAYPGYHWGPEVVPKNSYFVLSDSRLYGFDSRTFGYIDEKYIYGIASKILWSWNLEDGVIQWGRTASSVI